ncbi:hypothetical protein ACFFWD_08155 [Bradyrhizobium erythrophlei]|uniref:hypothetical protein n=1 Tax=Bradyrhizobium erythrophlei TaxID=1437360 RepID=UPI0035E4B24C
MIERKERVRDHDLRDGNPEQGLGSPSRSAVVFYGDPRVVSDAFALALGAMQANADLLMTATCSTSEND